MRETIFNADLVNNQMYVEREFEAPVEHVWKAWTDSDLLAGWWAPKPFKAITKTMDFRNGGHWHYYMLGPDGSKFWCMVNYLTIETHKRFDVDDFFCDEAGNRSNELPGMHWDNVFAASSNGTKVNVTITFDSKEDLEKIISMGFKEGFSAAHNNLDVLLAEIKIK